jgi:hypothetical protein
LESQNKSIADLTVIYKQGGDVDPDDPLLNPASVLLGANVCSDNVDLAKAFMSWMVNATGGQQVVATYSQPGVSGYLYTTAPNCTLTPASCAGW